jgi:hypothetical protein
MKRLLLILLLLFCSVAIYAQLPYTWTTGVNPVWASSDGVLTWQTGCNVVTTNCNGNYANNINSTYTSPSINASCPNATTISISFVINGSAEYPYDFIFLEYSTNGGSTWTNILGAGIGWSGSTFGVPTLINGLILPTNPNIRFRFKFTSDNTIRDSGYRILDFDIVCNVVLPVELTYFEGDKISNTNVLTWETESENNNDYFMVEWTSNPTLDSWTNIGFVNGAGNSTNQNTYYLSHDSYTRNEINYYRLTQVDFDGGTKVYDELVAINNTIKTKEIIRIINLLGQEVDINTSGIVIVQYLDGSILRQFNK